MQFSTTDTGPGTLAGHAIDQMHGGSAWSAMMTRKHNLQVVTVPCAPMRSLLASAGITRADLFSLDVEQNELRVLRTIDFSAFRFAVAFVELECPGKANALSVQDKDVRALLTRHGYTYVMRNRGNDVWIDRKVPWARRGAASLLAALRGRSVNPEMIDRNCCDGRGAANMSICLGSGSKRMAAPAYGGARVTYRQGFQPAYRQGL